MGFELKHAGHGVQVVDLCHSLCGVAAKKVQQKGWKNVTVVEADACMFAPPEETVTLVSKV